MCGADVTQEGLFLTRQTADYVREDHPLVAIRELLNWALREMDVLFESIYEQHARGVTRCHRNGCYAGWCCKRCTGFASRAVAGGLRRVAFRAD